MKREELGRSAFGPILTLLAGLLLVLLTKVGIPFAHNEAILFALIAFSGFYAGVASAVISLAVAVGLYALTLGSDAILPVFYDSEEVKAISLALPVVVVMIGLLRRRLDNRIQESEQGFLTVAENMDEIFFLLSTDFTELVYINPAFEKITGVSIEAMRKDPSVWLEAVHPEDKAEVMRYIQTLIDGSWPPSRAPEPYRVIRPDGTIRWLAPRAKVLPGKSGAKARFAGFARDITAEIEAGKKEQDATQRLNTVLNNAPVAIFSTDKDGVLMLRKGRGGARAGVRPDQGIGASYFEQFKDEPKHLENVRRALRGESLTDRLRIRKGYYEIAYGPILESDGRLVGMIGIATDITERHSAEEQVRDLDVVKNKFIQVVSHQLRTPLSAVRWNLETLISDDLGKLKREQKEFLRVTYLANGEVITRINDLLLAMDIEEGRTATVREPIALEPIWQSVMAEMKKHCDLKGLKCAYAMPSKELPAVSVDAEKIRAVFEKLADNAVQYTPKGTISTKLERDGETIRFEIADTGIGIPKQEQRRVFDRFYRASNATNQRTDASGLGLYIAQHFVESHGGKIGFTSKEDEGTTFWFEIPLTEPPEA